MRTADEIIKGMQASKDARLHLDSVYRDCFDFTDPLRGAGINQSGTLSDSDSMVSDSSSKLSRLFDSTGQHAAMLLASAVVGGVTPSNSRWFDLDVPSQPENRNAWLDDSADITWKEIHASNFDAAGYETIYDSVIAGVAVCFIDYDREAESLRFEEWPIASTYISASKAGGAIDTIYRCFSLTAEQAYAEYGENKMRPQNKGLSDSVLQAAKSEPSRKIEFIQCIYPTGKKGGVKSDELPFASCHIERNSRKVVRESGYHEFPCAVPRWFAVPSSPWAVGPVYKALPDIKTLNKAVQFTLQNAEMQMAGMWGAVDDGVINPATIRVGARQIVVVSDKNNFFPITPGGNIQIGEVMIGNMRRSVQQTMMVDNLQLPQDRDMTATEVNTRMEILRQILAPIYGRIQSEWLQPLVARSFGLLLRNGKIEPPPEELATARLGIRYISPLARAQRMGEVAAMDRYEMTLAQTAAFNPEVLDVYNWDDAERERSYLLGVPQKLIPSENEVKQRREARVQAQAAQAQAAQQQALEQEAMKQGSGNV